MVPEIANVARDLAYRRAGLELRDHEDVHKESGLETLDFLPENPLVIVDTADLHCWSGKQPGSLSRFNFYSATLAVELAGMIAANLREPAQDIQRPVGIVTPYAAQRRLLSKLVKEMQLSEWVAPGTVHTFQGGEADIVIFDSVLDEPYYSARLCNPHDFRKVLRDLNVAVTRAKMKFVFVGSSEWLNKYAKINSGLGLLWDFLKRDSDLVSAFELVEHGFYGAVSQLSSGRLGWRLPEIEAEPILEILDETTFFQRFAIDISNASKNVFGLAPYFGKYRWPKVQPLIAAAVQRGVEVTLVIPPLKEAENLVFVEAAIRNLRDLGAVVVTASGLHGKDIVIDETILYTGSLNWPSHRGRDEIVHRMYFPSYAAQVLEFMQAKYIRNAAVYEDGTPRACPECGGPIQIVNQRRQHGRWDHQAIKLGCASYQAQGCKGYLRNVDERPPYREVPRCSTDGRTKYRRVRRGKGEVWQCPKHPRECPRFKVVPGDP